MNSAGVVPLPTAAKWAFGVEIAGIDPTFWHKASLPEIEFDEVANNPAGSMFAQKAQGRAKFPDITLERYTPSTKVDSAFITWARQCITVNVATGSVPADYMRDIDIVQYDNNGNEFRRFRLFRAFPKSFKFGDLEGGSSDSTSEVLVLCYQYFDIV